MKSRYLLTCAFSLMMLLALPGQTRADAITITFSEDTASFSLFVESTLGINGKETHILNGGSDWRLMIRMDEREETTGGDSMLSEGRVRHIKAPHGEPENPNHYFFIEPIFAVVQGPGMHARKFPPGHKEHPNLGHFDDFESRLEWVAAPRPGTDLLDITRWTLIVKGKHSEGDGLALPEPSTFVLLTLGIVALPLLRRLSPHT